MLWCETVLFYHNLCIKLSNMWVLSLTIRRQMCFYFMNAPFKQLIGGKTNSSKQNKSHAVKISIKSSCVLVSWWEKPSLTPSHHLFASLDVYWHRFDKKSKSIKSLHVKPYLSERMSPACTYQLPYQSLIATVNLLISDGRHSFGKWLS